MLASCDAAAARNLMLAIERCHLRVEAMVASPYASGLSALVDDEAELGSALVDLGGGTTTVGVFAGDRLVHVDAVAVGGNHVTMDVARGLSIEPRRRRTAEDALRRVHRVVVRRSRNALRCIARRRRHGSSQSHLPKSQLVRIIRPRVEEILELVRDRLATAGHASHAGRRLVLTGRRQPTDRAARTRAGDHFEAGAYRSPARRRRLAGIGQEPGFCGRGRIVDLSAGRGPRAFRAGAVGGSARRGRPSGYVARVGRWLKQSF